MTYGEIISPFPQITDHKGSLFRLAGGNLPLEFFPDVASNTTLPPPSPRGPHSCRDPLNTQANKGTDIVGNLAVLACYIPSPF